MTDASMARPGVDDDGDVGLATILDVCGSVVGEVAPTPCCLPSPTAVVDSPALARRRRSSRRGLGAICGRGRGDVGDATDELAAREVDTWLGGIRAVGLDVTATLPHDGDATDVGDELDAGAINDVVATSSQL